VLHSLRAREPELGIALHVGELRAERADSLAVALGERPQPGGVDVGVADRGELVGHRGVAALEQRGEDGLGLVPGGAILRPDVADAVQLRQQLAGPGRIEPLRGVGLEATEHVEVVVQAPGARVEARDLTAVEHDRLERGIRARQLAEEAVAGELDAEVEALAAGGACEHHGVGAGTVGTGVEALDGPAVHPEGRLAVADPEQVDALAAPLLRNGCAHLEPVGGPERAEALSKPGGAVVETVGIVEVDPVDRPGYEELIRVAYVRVDLGADPVAHLGNAVAGVAGMAQHEGTTLPTAAGAHPLCRAQPGSPGRIPTLTRP